MVVEKRLDSNELIVAFDRLDTEGLYARRCRIGNISFTNKPLSANTKIAAKPRYRAKAAPVAFEALGERSAMLEFDEPQRALTPGQICALYDGEKLLGGGVFEDDILNGQQIVVRDFRCFSNLEIEFHPESTCIIGRNASGKTSLLEAVSVLTRLQSPRTSSLVQLVRLGAKGLVTDGFVSDYHLQFYYSATRRKLALDAVEQKSSKYLPRRRESGLFRQFRH